MVFWCENDEELPKHPIAKYFIIIGIIKYSSSNWFIFNSHQMILNYTYLNNTNHTYFKAKLLIILFLAHMGSIVSKTIVEDRQITSKT